MTKYLKNKKQISQSQMSQLCANFSFCSEVRDLAKKIINLYKTFDSNQRRVVIQVKMRT